LRKEFMLIYILTPLIVGFIFPFWYAFLQGAVFDDRAVLRSKGWIYAYYGLFLYFVMLLPHALGKVFPDNSLVNLSGLITLPVGFSSKSVAWKISSKILEVCEKTPSELDKKIAELTSESAMHFLLASLLLILYLDSLHLELLAGILVFTIFGLWAELISHRYIKKYDKPYRTIYAKKNPRIARAFLVAGIAFSAILVFYISIPDPQPLIEMAMLLALSLSFILSIWFRPTTTMHFTKDDSIQ